MTLFQLVANQSYTVSSTVPAPSSHDMPKTLFVIALALLGLAFPTASVTAQDLPAPLEDDRPFEDDEFVSVPPDTPFSDFVQYINPLFQRRYGKPLVDPTGRTSPIGFSTTGLNFVDALGFILDNEGLVIREGARYFQVGLPDAPVSGVRGGAADLPEATDREVRIDGLIFEVNLNRVREIGSDWSSVFGSQQGGQQGGQQGQQQDRLRFFLRTRSFFDAISEVIVGPDRIDLAELNSIFRLLETNGVGRTISAPSIKVRSGQTGRIQSGSDIPFTVRDFSGNTVNQFVSTGVIVEAIPTVIQGEDENGNSIEFVHLVVGVERSNSRPTAAGIAIDKNEGETDLMLLDGEQTVIGGLYGTEQSFERRGIPILKDLPVLGYFFGVTTRTETERELIIILKSTLVDRLSTRLRQSPPNNLIQQERGDREARFNQSQQGLGEDVDIDEANIQEAEVDGL